MVVTDPLRQELLRLLEITPRGEDRHALKSVLYLYEYGQGSWMEQTYREFYEKKVGELLDMSPPRDYYGEYTKQERLPAMNESTLTASETVVFVDSENLYEVTVTLSDGEGEVEIVGTFSELLDLTSKIRQALRQEHPEGF